MFSVAMVTGISETSQSCSAASATTVTVSSDLKTTVYTWPAQHELWWKTQKQETDYTNSSEMNEVSVNAGCLRLVLNVVNTRKSLSSVTLMCLGIYDIHLVSKHPFNR